MSNDHTSNHSCFHLLRQRWEEYAMVCVGLDVDSEKIPEHIKRSSRGWVDAIVDFACRIVDKTWHYACAFKLNFWFYMNLPDGVGVIGRIVTYIHEHAPGVPVILDAKVGDVESTNKIILKLIERLEVQGITVNPYVGGRALEPFWSKKNLGLFVLCHTSNTEAEEFQGRDIPLDREEMRAFDRQLYPDEPGREYMGRPTLDQFVAFRFVTQWNMNNNCGLVVGATKPKALRDVREIVGPDMPLLLPGFGTQGGTVEEAYPAAMDPRGTGVVPNWSSGILYASSGEDYAEAAGKRAMEYNNQCLACARKP